MTEDKQSSTFRTHFSFIEAVLMFTDSDCVPLVHNSLRTREEKTHSNVRENNPLLSGHGVETVFNYCLDNENFSLHISHTRL